MAVMMSFGFPLSAAFCSAISRAEAPKGAARACRPVFTNASFTIRMIGLSERGLSAGLRDGYHGV